MAASMKGKRSEGLMLFSLNSELQGDETIRLFWPALQSKVSEIINFLQKTPEYLLP
jgi:hypothetical protein